MLPTYKFDLIQCLQQACAVFFCDIVAKYQIPALHSCLSSFAATSYIINLNTNCYYIMKIIEMVKYVTCLNTEKP
jgi:hypothetical protein